MPGPSSLGTHPADLYRRTSNASWTLHTRSEQLIAIVVILRERRRWGQIGAVQQNFCVLLEHVAGLLLCIERFLKRGQVVVETREAELLDIRRRLRCIGTQKYAWGLSGPGYWHDKPGLAELDEGQPRRGGARDVDQQCVPIGVAGDRAARGRCQARARGWRDSLRDPFVALQEVGAQRRLPAGGGRPVAQGAVTQRIRDVRCTGHDEIAILTGTRAAIFESPADVPLQLGVDADDLAAVFAGFDGRLGVVLGVVHVEGDDRHYQVEDVLGEPRGDDPFHGVRGIGEPCKVAPRGRTYVSDSRIAPQRAGEVDDDLVVGMLAIAIDDSPIDEDTLRRWIQDPVSECAIADRGMHKASIEQKRPAKIALAQECALCEVRRLDEHRAATSAPRVSWRADPVWHAIRPRRRLADEQSVVLNVLDSAESAEQGLGPLLELPGCRSDRRKYGQRQQAKGGAT